MSKPCDHCGKIVYDDLAAGKYLHIECYKNLLRQLAEARALLRRCAEIIHENYEHLLDTEQANRLLTDLKAYATESEGEK